MRWKGFGIWGRWLELNLYYFTSLNKYLKQIGENSHDCLNQMVGVTLLCSIMFEMLSNLRKMADVNHHSENILQAPSSFTKDKLSDAARFSCFSKKQMEIYDE